MNTERVENEKKIKANIIQKKMKEQWIPKSTEQDNTSNGNVTQMGDSTLSN